MNNDSEDRPRSDEEERALRMKQLNRTVCICNGIRLGRVLKAMEGCETVAEVNQKAGTGSGGCKGERCGPRIRILLRKKKELLSGAQPTQDDAEEPSSLDEDP